VARVYGNPQGQWLADLAQETTGLWEPMAIPDLLWHDPAVKSVPPIGTTSRWFRNAGVVVCRDGWADDATVATFRSPEAYVLGHTHLDSCSFTLFRRADLALDAGLYDEYASSHHRNYYSRTIAHNSLTIFDPDETFVLYGETYANDGGQRWLATGVDVPHAWPCTPEDTIERARGYRLGGIVKYEDDAGYTYAVGDGGPSYSSDKLAKFHRHFLWLSRVAGWDTPVLVIFDDVTATKSSFRKAYLLHTSERPEVNGRFVTARNGDAVLYQWTVAPKDVAIDVVGGRGKEFFVNGVDYPPSRGPRGKEEPGAWRVEVSPEEKRVDHQLLHVLFPADRGTTPPREPKSFVVDTRRGVTVGDWVVLFDFGSPLVATEYDTQLPSSFHLICGAVPFGDYSVYLDGQLIDTATGSFCGLLRFDLKGPGRVRIEAAR
jgi:hypothetical protein